MTKYDHKSVESKWQEVWKIQGLYTPDVKKAKNKFYNLWMFPYPSAEGLHVGTIFAATGSDIYGRFMRMQGKDIFQPIGYDSFGIHGENFALKIGKSPQEVMQKTLPNYQRQLKDIGHGYDWTRTVTTSDIDYYRWTQWLFVQMFKAGLAYKKKASVNWCPSCKTVLADEQVFTPAAAGKWPKQYQKLEDVPEGIKVCERCGNEPERKELEQWFFRITDYANRLLEGLGKIDWSERVVIAQRNWIGRKEGMRIKFDDIEVFTTRPDTLAGATFVAVPGDSQNDQTDKTKAGEFTGKYVTNPLTRRKIPVWKANYVAAEYGLGAIMGVPAHDARDMEFATKYDIDIEEMKPDESLWQRIEKESWGKKTVNYHLRDWLISRQRYWGPPIPMIYCPTCAKQGDSWLSKNGASLRKDQTDWEPGGWYPEENLPVALPEISDYKPEGMGKGPLANHPEFYETKCPYCGGDATRETDVSDTFVDSSWYFLRYPSVGFDGKSSLLRGPSAASRSAVAIQNLPWDSTITRKWLPVDLYFGGAEHAVLHLMYARFITKVFYDLKLIDFDEPFPKFYAHGLMIKDGAKMSKSRGNVVNPDEYIAKYGADTLRLYLMFMGPMDGSPDFRDTGIEGMYRFLTRLWRLFDEHTNLVLREEKDARELLIKMHQTIKKVTEDIENFKYNTAIAAIMEYINVLYEKASRAGSVKTVSVRCAEWDEALKNLTLLIAPFAPHLAEEVWVNILGEKFSVHRSAWPKYDPDLIKDKSAVVILQVDGKLRGSLIINSEQAKSRKEIETLAKSDPKIIKWLEGKSRKAGSGSARKVKKVIFVKGKLINFVTS